MDFNEKVLDIIAEVAEDDVVKTNPDIQLFEEGIMDSLQSVQLLVAFQEELDIEVSIMDFNREDWGTPNQIINELAKLR
ncbi:MULTISPECIES: D-alanine--poly(phosphoribitol) ligase subunit DltC [Staphylococcus]|uniref:D-alanyl carrier protein n=1 Tax=Staphylococcus coagulans TaxID=74706 RepID=A0A9X1E5W3_9STAP|nr:MULTISPECIES: D-alanine--poly(phosphoribitol) ligase subunit DltC [Staphylococcus]NHA35485.1 D-alanine--poly(phosphoribitol) ligase subunit 2 [Staphylococcus schleiferi]MBA8773025.1 D-alanine--poly(phosphoribitol) ligase subunit DltC [Staphylococcus coagulans]MBA8777613.1 D-alanine--poly(phosphoribitol) ligase subunit DltC [Staphylococcus coagulans]MBT2829996.1 D-alanine--poly(phosphoribitol) ligase subunit DltC [Staphylococcus coagulans]MBT2860481.1 D-alanine--poly(phosphoribitol) ligase s